MTPEPHDARDLLAYPPVGLTGPAVQVMDMEGSTSGRFEVAQVIARLFPAYGQFVRNVIAEGLEPASDFPFGPYATDVVTRKSRTTVEFVTPSNMTGIGTDSRLLKSNDPIHGVEMLFPNRDMELMGVFVRLPPDLVRFAPVIINAIERTSTRK